MTPPVVNGSRPARAMARRPPELAKPVQQRRFRTALFAAALLFMAALVLSAVYELDRSQREAQQRAAHEIDALARVFAEQTRRSLQTVDIMLRSVAVAYRNGNLPPLKSRAMHDELAAQREQFDNDVTAVFITDPQGERLSSSKAYPAPAGNVAGRALFSGLQTGSRDDAYVGDAVHWLATGRWAVPLARRLEGPHGQLDGVVGALLDAGYFDNFYAAVHLERGTSIALLHEGGALVARFPRQDAEVGQPVPAYHDLPQDAAPSAVPTILRTSSGARIAVARPVPGFAMTVVVTRELGDVLAPWREQALWVLLRTGTLMLMMAALLAVVLRHLARENVARARLHESEQRYALAVAGSNEGLWDWNLTNGELFVSERAQQLAGMEPGPPLRPRRAWQTCLTVHPEDVPYLREEMKAHLDGRRPHFDVELRAALRRAEASDAVRAEPEWGWYRQRGLAIRDARGRPLRMAGSIENIDERKHSERERQRLEGQLRQAQKLEAIGTLAGGIAHDFNNILSAILGYGELARLGAESGSPQARHLDGVMSAGQRAKALVERILAFSRSGLGDRVPVHVQSVVTEALDLLLPSLPAGITLTRTLAAGDTAVVGDPTQIHQVVMNLCTNAMQAMPHGGVLAVSLALRQQAVTLALSTGEIAAGGYVCLTVRDEGQGIEPGVVHRIFDPFFTTKGVGAGTGLGLSLVHGIVTDLGGGIDVSSLPGMGTTFAVWLPCSGRALAQAQADVQLPLGNGQHILLVDDEVALVHVGEEMLALLGYEAAGYTSSVEAFAAFAADPQRFDAVLTDETMPQLSGSQMALQMRRIRPELPIVLMSGYVGPAIAALARQSKVNEVLPKPLVSRDIARTLVRLFAA